MTLATRIQLIDDMVKENPDVTIKDYVELVREINRIKSSRKLFVTKVEERYKELRKEFISK